MPQELWMQVEVGTCSYVIKGRTVNEQLAITTSPSPWDVVTMCECLRREADFLEEGGEEVGCDRPRKPTGGHSGVRGLQAQGTGLV